MNRYFLTRNVTYTYGRHTLKVSLAVLGATPGIERIHS